MRTGSRCTILVKLPVAFSGGSKLNSEPLAGAKLSTLPSMRLPENASTAIVTFCPARIRSSCVSVKLATT